MIISQSSLLEERGQLACCRGGIARRRRSKEKKEELLLREGAIEQPYDWRTCISIETSSEGQLNCILGSFTDR